MGVREGSSESEWETDSEEALEAKVEVEAVVEEGCPVKPGDVLVSARPFIYAIQPQFKTKVCDWCFLFNEEWKGITLCPACLTVGYCSKACEQAAREQHRAECSLVTLRDKRTWPHRVWFLARACLLLGSEGWDQPDRINNSRSRAFRDLVDHYGDVTGDPSKAENQWWQKEVGELLGDLMPPMEEYLSIYGRLLVNSFALRVDNKGEEESVGTALYRANSIFDHSCRPSATTVFTGGRLQIKATVASDSLDLGQYFISYMDEAESRPQRQAKLKRTWYFECQCPACSDPAGERGKHAAVCDREGCGGQVCVDLGSWAWEDCLACGQSLSKTSRFQYQETYETVRQVVDENGGEIQYTDVAEFLVKQMVGKFHPADLQLMQAAAAASHGNSHDKLWAKAITYLELALPGVRKYYSPLQGYLGPMLLQYGEALHALGRELEARAAVQEAEALLRVIPGSSSHMYCRHYGPRARRVLRTQP